MLALTRKRDEAIIINGNIEIKILDIQGDKVKVGIIAPREVGIYRQEIYQEVKHNNEEAVRSTVLELKGLEKIIGEL